MSFSKNHWLAPFLVRIVMSVAITTLVVFVPIRFSKWKAETAANEFVGEAMMAQLPFERSWLSFYSVRVGCPGNNLPRWVVRYGTAFSEGFNVEVSVFGKVIACNVQALDILIGMPEAERKRMIDAIILKGSSHQENGVSR